MKSTSKNKKKTSVVSDNEFWASHTFYRKKAASAANIRPVPPAAVTRSALFLPVLFAESVGFRAEVSVPVVCEGLVAAAGALYKIGKLMSDHRRQGDEKKDVHNSV